VTLASQVTIAENVLAQEVGEEVVLLDLAHERYFGLDPVGTLVWRLLPDMANLKAVSDRLCEEFDGKQARIEEDLIDLVQKMLAAELIHLRS